MTQRKRKDRNQLGLIVPLVIALAGAGSGILLSSHRESAHQSVIAFSPPPTLSLSHKVGLRVGDKAPNFAVRSLDGRTLTLAALRGHPSVLYFIAYWCGSCLEGARALQRLNTQFAGKGLRIVAVDIDPTSSTASLRQFISAAGSPSYTFARDLNGRSTAAFQVSSLDTTIVVDRQGVIRFRQALRGDDPTLTNLVGALL